MNQEGALAGRSPLATCFVRLFSLPFASSLAATTALVLSTGATAFPSPAPDWLEQVCQETESIEAPAKADGFILHDTTEIEIPAKGAVKSHVRRAVRILTVDGEDYATLSEEIAPFCKVEDLKGWLILPSGKTVELSRSDILEIGSPEAGSYYTDSRLLEARLPDPRPGAVAAFEYKVVEDGWIGAFQSFTFQVQDPVHFAELSVRIPDGWQLAAEEWMTEGIEHVQQDGLHTWTARDLAYRPEEPFMPSWGRLARRVNLAAHDPSSHDETRFPDWQSVASWCAELHDPHAAPDARLTLLAGELTAGLETPQAKFDTIGTYVRDQIRYVAVEIGKNRWEPRDAALTQRNLYGDCKDKATLMRALLLAAGIPSVSVLANGQRPALPGLPSPFQFNHCIVGVPAASLAAAGESPPGSVDAWVFFDPTDPTARPGRIPSGLESTAVLPAASQSAGLIELPDASAEDNRRCYGAFARLDPAGSIEASVRICDHGDWAASSAHRMSSTTESKQVENWQKVLSRVSPGARISNFSSAVDGDSAWVTFQVHTRVASGSGTMILLNPDFIRRVEWPDLSAPERTHPIWLGSPVQVLTDITWQFPSNWTAEPVAPIHSSCAAGRIDCEVTSSGNSLRYVALMERNGALLEPEHYAEVQRFVKDARAMQAMAVVVKE